MKLVLIALLGATTVGSAYDFIGSPAIKWPAGAIPVYLQLDETRTPTFLRDGRSSWNAVAEEALELWNAHLSEVQFEFRDSSFRGDGNRRNEVFFSDDIYGHRFGARVLAVTTVWRYGSRRIEGDTIFNNDISWDSYRGDRETDVHDLRRVAIHEFGHTLGLDHPDEAKQIMMAVMNSRISDLDALADDDIRGAQALYPAVDARFALNVQIVPPEGGVVLVEPTVEGDGKYAPGTPIRITAKPNRRFRFNFWDGDEPNTARILKFTMTENESLVANFVTNAAPRVVSPPTSQLAREGESILLRARAANAPRGGYQWLFNGEEIFGAVAPTLWLQSVGHDDSGEYSVIVTNGKASTISKPARIIVDGY